MRRGKRKEVEGESLEREGIESVCGGGGEGGGGGGAR